MSESGTFQIRFSTNYEETLKNLVRSRYKGNKQGALEFFQVLETIVASLENIPRPKPPLGHLEAWTHKTHEPGWEFWKIDFTMPQLKGSAKKGRLMYLINVDKKEIVLVWIYTHAEFEKRPPDGVLRSVLKGEMSDSNS